MAKGELLRLVYNDSNVTYYTSGGPIYRKFVTDRKGEEYVEYRNAHDELLGIAREIRYGTSNRVQFLDRVDNELAFAEVRYGLLDAPMICFFDASDRVTPRAKRFLSREEMARINAKDPEKSPPEEKAPPIGVKGCMTTVLGWVLIIAGIFVCGIFAKLLTEEFAHLHARAYELLNVVQIIATRLPCVIAAVLCLIFLRLPKGMGKGSVVFWAVVALLTVVPFYFLGIQLDRMMQPHGVGIQGWNNVKFFALSFVPGLAYAVAVRIELAFVKKSSKAGSYRTMAHRAGVIYVVLSGVLIFVSRMTAAYVWQFATDFSSGMFFAFRMIWYALLVGGINKLLLAIIDDN